MGDEDVRLRGAAGSRRVLAVAEHAQSSAAIENKLRTVRGNQLKTWRVSTITPSGWVHRGRGASHTPEAQLCKGSGHCSRRTGLGANGACAYASIGSLPMVAVKPESVNEFKLGKCQTA